MCVDLAILCEGRQVEKVVNETEKNKSSLADGRWQMASRGMHCRTVVALDPALGVWLGQITSPLPHASNKIQNGTWLDASKVSGLLWRRPQVELSNHAAPRASYQGLEAPKRW